MDIQRVLINSGFTIDNRRLLISKIGRREYSKLAKEVKTYTPFVKQIFSKTKFRLNQDGDSLVLNLSTEKDRNTCLKDIGINLASLKMSVSELFARNLDRNRARELYK